MSGTRVLRVVGAGLAGSEAAWVLARLGLEVELLEMKPEHFSPAHSLAGPAELVCSNSLKSDSTDTAHGLLKEELRALGSVVLLAAEAARVPAGTALAVDRTIFSQAVEERLRSAPRIDLRMGRRLEVPEGDGAELILATGPLTDGPLAGWLAQALGASEQLHFYDALAPILEAEGIDRTRVFAASRWGKGGDDYLNCAMDEAEYRRFVEALRDADTTPLRDFEDPKYFESCLPVEVIASRGDDALAFGPLRPVGFEVDGRRPFAVVQLRAENRQGSAYNLVGFQTKLTQSAQREVFRLIPGLESCRFLRYGAVHRNLYVNSPRALDDGMRLIGHRGVRLAGQMTGVEGYMESAAMGLWVGMLLGAECLGVDLPEPPRETALGALWAHVRGRLGAPRFEPMNIHFGLLPARAARGRKNRRQAAIEQARRSFAEWLENLRRDLPEVLA